MHFASHNGAVEICEELIKAGADINKISAHGLNVLHLAAQGDQPVTLYYFHKNKGMSLTTADNQGSTPIHWAVFQQSEIAVLYLLAWAPPSLLTAVDKDGQMALHIAVRKAESTRVVRLLLSRGSPTDIVNLAG